MTRQPTPDIMADLLGPVHDEAKLVRSRLSYDYGLIPAEQRNQVQDAAVEIVQAGRRAQDDLMKIGQRLIEVKELLEHGQFQEWCETEFQMTARTARNMMNVAKVFGDKTETVSVLSDSAMYLLAAPSTPEEARVEVIEQAQQTGKSPTKSEVQETIKKHQPPPAQTYLEVWKLEGKAYDLAKEWDMDPAMMREGARQQLGSYWGELTHRVNQGGQYRASDLKQAINNVAHQMEAKAAGTNSPAGTDLDPWAIAALTPGSRQLRSESLARAITPWIREYRDTYGRNWQDLARDGNPAHMNSVFLQDIGKECKRRALTVKDDTLKLAIKQAFAWLLADEPPKTQAAKVVLFGVTAHTWEGYKDWTDADDAEYTALSPIWQQDAGTFNSINESRRITRWRVAARLASERRDNLAFSLQESARRLGLAERFAASQAQPAEQTAVEWTADEWAKYEGRQAAVLTPDREQRAVTKADAAFGLAQPQTRNERIDALLHVFQAAVDALPELGELTGHYMAGTAALRELNKVMQTLRDNKIGGFKAHE